MRTGWMWLCLAVLSLSFVFLVGGCATLPSNDSWVPIGEKGGAQLWTENCTRCHNSRSPSEFSDAQWDVATTHMRVRANMTSTEAEKIVKFLQSGN